LATPSSVGAAGARGRAVRMDRLVHRPARRSRIRVVLDAGQDGRRRGGGWAAAGGCEQVTRSGWGESGARVGRCCLVELGAQFRALDGCGVDGIDPVWVFDPKVGGLCDPNGWTRVLFLRVYSNNVRRLHIHLRSFVY
jgi:hypothetical protein